MYSSPCNTIFSELRRLRILNSDWPSGVLMKLLLSRDIMACISQLLNFQTCKHTVQVLHSALLSHQFEGWGRQGLPVLDDPLLQCPLKENGTFRTACTDSSGQHLSWKKGERLSGRAPGSSQDREQNDGNLTALCLSLWG